jgi:hypothetical protein
MLADIVYPNCDDEKTAVRIRIRKQIDTKE